MRVVIFNGGVFIRYTVGVHHQWLLGKELTVSIIVLNSLPFRGLTHSLSFSIKSEKTTGMVEFIFSLIIKHPLLSSLSWGVLMLCLLRWEWRLVILGNIFFFPVWNLNWIVLLWISNIGSSTIGLVKIGFFKTNLNWKSLVRMGLKTVLICFFSMLCVCLFKLRDWLCLFFFF